jgi:tellurite resistance protein TerC
VVGRVHVFVLAMLALDLGVFHRKAHVVGLREAATWSAVWVGLALVFNAGLWLYAGSGPGLEFLTGYLIEKSLSVDNIFVFVMLFTYFAVPAQYQHRVLFWASSARWSCAACSSRRAPTCFSSSTG